MNRIYVENAEIEIYNTYNLNVFSKWILKFAKGEIFMKISKRSRELYDELSAGFNTWDVQSVTAHVLLPERLRINVGFFVPRINQYTSNNLWDQVERFGEHTVDGSYTEVFIRFRDGVYRVESSGGTDELIIRVTPETPRYNMYISLEVGEMFGKNFSFRYKHGGILADNGKKSYFIRSLTDDPMVKWDPVTCPHLIADAAEICYFTVNSDKTAKEIDETLKSKRNEWLSSTVYAEGDLGAGIAAMRRSLLWNIIYDFTNDRVITPVSRNWCRRGSDFGDYVLFDWDTFFGAMQYGLIDKRLAYSTVFSILEEGTDSGMIPNFGCGSAKSYDRSEPQVGAMCVWKLYVQFRDKWFLEECFDALLRWNDWRFENRDFKNNGLLELASEPWELSRDDELWCDTAVGEKLGAMLESGLDNSPMWDRAVFNEENHCMELYYVGLNALMVMDCEFLEKIATELGRTEDAERMRARRLNLSAKIENKLWDEKTESYMNRNWDGTFDPCKSLTHFYTITAGLGKDGRREKMLEHLLDPSEFWGDYVIPNVSRDDPAFPEQEYWRGRIWAPTNFLVNEGLIRIRRKDIWDELVKKGFDMFIKCWKERGVVGENYNAVTGEAAEEGKASDRFYHWGALLVYMAVGRVINFNEWTDKVEVRKAPDWLSNVHNVPIKDSKISVG